MANELQHKSVSVEIKDADKGIVELVFAQTGVKDLDGDWTMAGAFGQQRVALSPYGHTWRQGEPPIGKGSITEKGDKAIGEFQVFMNIPKAREQFEVVKEMGDLQQWSYGFTVLETGELTQDLRQKGVWRVIKKTKVHEVSPVLVGAGLNTRTVAAKDARPDAGAPARHRVVCDCGRVLGESPESLVFVAKAKELAEIKVPGPRDVRYCKSCALHAVYIPASSLTKPAA